MSTYLVSFLAAIILIALSMLGLAIGYCITGKSKFSNRKCRPNPSKKDKNGKKKDHCDFCGKK